MRKVTISARLGALLLECAVLTCFLCGTSTAARPDPIRKYRPYFASGICDSQEVVAIRTFDRFGKSFFLAVDPYSLRVNTVASQKCSLQSSSWVSLYEKYANTPYVRALAKAKERAFILQDAGIVHGFSQEHGITLTVDLCPSHKNLDRALFNGLVAALSKKERPIPVALSITGRFMRAHSEDIRWLRSRMDAGDIAVTWVNHTYNHRYNPKRPLVQNFLLSPGTDIRSEILQTEVALLEQGFTPSIFFRFPGLVSDERLVSDVSAFGLVPIGTDAWLAKGERVSDGSIVLIHGNGNEPLGIKDFFKLLKTEEPEVIAGHWHLYDLREAVRKSMDERMNVPVPHPTNLYFLRRDTLAVKPAESGNVLHDDIFWTFPDASVDAEATDALQR